MTRVPSTGSCRRARLAACTVLLSSWVAACEVEPATPSGAIVVPYQLSIEFGIEQEDGVDHTARARLYDITQAYDITGNAGTIELSDGDAIYADGRELDVETRTTYLSTLRVDYSTSIPAGDAACLFEFRRPDDERIEATVPIPERFEVDEIGEVHAPGPAVLLTWSPVVPGATMAISIRPLDEGCLTVVGAEAGDVVKQLDDQGSYAFHTDAYHSIHRDCRYELIFERRHVQTVGGRWFKDGHQLPANDVHAVGIHTARATFVAARR